MKTHIIALAGLASVGKDTVADLLVTHAGFRKLAFADALRGEVASGFEIDLSLLTDRHTKETPTPALALSRGPTNFCNAVIASWAVSDQPGNWRDQIELPRSPRQILQWWGTEYRRAASPRYWLAQLNSKINHERRAGETRFVISDCRFENEADLIRALGGQVWQITREGVTPENTSEGNHASATTGANLRPDLTLHNDHSIRHLQGIVRDAFLELEWPEWAKASA